MSPPTRLLGMILPDNLTRCNKIAYLEVKKLTKNMPGGQKFAPGSQKVSLVIFPYSVSVLEKFKVQGLP
jgi:hypothetical protein